MFIKLYFLNNILLLIYRFISFLNYDIQKRIPTLFVLIMGFFSFSKEYSRPIHKKGRAHSNKVFLASNDDKIYVQCVGRAAICGPFSILCANVTGFFRFLQRWTQQENLN